MNKGECLSAFRNSLDEKFEKHFSNSPNYAPLSKLLKITKSWRQIAALDEFNNRKALFSNLFESFLPSHTIPSALFI